MSRIFYIFGIISAVSSLGALGGDWDDKYFLQELDSGNYVTSTRNLRNIPLPYAGRHFGNQGVRFAWQNPVRVAPTLPPIRGDQSTQVNFGWTPTSTQQYTPRFPPREYTTAAPYYPDTTFPTASTPTYHHYPSTTEIYYPRNPTYATAQPARGDYYPRQPNRPEIAKGATTGEHSEFETLPESQPQIGERPESERCPQGTRRGRRNGKCYPLGSTQPCPENMAFYAEPRSQEFGQCDCIQHASRPLVYHQETNRCYFVFQQAYCQPGDWLILDPNQGNRPVCDVNRCISWTRNISMEWDFKANGLHLDKAGPVALLRERACTSLGHPCSREGEHPVRPILIPNRSQSSEISLRFLRGNLVCSRQRGKEGRSETQAEPETEIAIICKPGLLNRWRLEGNCQ